MFGLQEDSAERNEKRLKELMMRSEEQEEQLENLFKTQKLSSKEFLEFLANADNFDEKEWNTLQELRKEAADHLKQKLQPKNLLKTKKTYRELQDAQQWIFVR